jgi:D-inositol-3-phosphate glycosyltransferase
MRVAMLCVHSSPLARLGGKEAGGMNVYVGELAKELGRRGIAVDIFTRSQEPFAPKSVHFAPNVRVLNLHTGPAAPYDKNWVLTYLPEFVSRVRCFADGQDLTYDVIHSHYWLSGEAGLRLRRSLGAPLIHMFHTLGAMKNEVARGAEETETMQRISIERRLLHEADHIVAATPLDRAQMLERYGATAPIEIIPCGVDLDHFRPLSQADARARLDIPPAPHRMVLFVGRFEPLKGIDTLVRAAARLKQRYGDFCVALVGGDRDPDGWNNEARRIDQLRRELGVEQQVVFVGARSQRLLPLYYAAADALAMPSHYESFGMVALEAMSCGTPVVASRAGGLTYTVEDGASGFLVPVGDDAALAARLDALLGNDTLRATMSANARARALRFGWGPVADELLALYRSALQRQPAARLRLAS